MNRDGLGDLIAKWITALHFRGLGQAEAGIRAIQENLQLEDVSWCLRTDRSGRVDLNRSLRAIENGRWVVHGAVLALIVVLFARRLFLHGWSPLRHFGRRREGAK